MQCVLATSVTESFVIFLYADGEIQWDDNALAGINAGDGVNHITIPGSLTPSIINITQSSNVGIPGVWMFKVGKRNIGMFIFVVNICVCVCVCVYIHTHVYMYIYISYAKTPLM